MQKEFGTSRAVISVASDYDAACKRVLSEKQILARILHDYLDEFSGVSPEEIEKNCFEGDPRVGTDPVGRDANAQKVLSRANEDSTVAEGVVAFDIRFNAWAPQAGDSKERNLVCVELDVEAQSDFYPGYPLLKRGIFYGGRMLSMQGDDIVEKSHYERVRKVVSVWVCAHPPKKYAGTVTCFGIVPTTCIGSAEFTKSDYDLLELVMICLNDKEPGKSQGALGMLEVLLATGIKASDKLLTLRDRYGIIISEGLDEKVDTMCNLSKGAILEGYEQGMKQGLADGMKQGLADGMKEGMKRGRADERAAFMGVVASMVRDGTIAMRVASERFGFTEQELIAVI